MNKWILRVPHENLTREKATYKVYDWKMKSHARLEVFASVSWERPSCEVLAKLSVWQKVMFCFTKFIPTLYIYPHYPQIVRSAFQRENSKKYTWELEIVIPIIIYTFPCGFPQLLPFYFYILERLIAQTLTTTILIVKWDFGVAGKYWKEPFIGGCSRAELRDSES